MPKYFRTFGTNPKIESIFLFCIMYKLYNPYFIFWIVCKFYNLGTFGFIYIYIYIYIFIYMCIYGPRLNAYAQSRSQSLAQSLPQGLRRAPLRRRCAQQRPWATNGHFFDFGGRKNRKICSHIELNIWP